MPDNLLSENDQKEHLSLAFVAAIAAKAGYALGQYNIDRDSVDLEIKGGGGMRPAIAMQLKASSTLEVKGGKIPFSLSAKNYNDLRAPRQTPIILVVYQLPRDPNHWLECSLPQITLRRCARWLSLKGFPETTNDSKTVHIPWDQTLDVKSMQTLMQKSREGEL